MSTNDYYKNLWTQPNNHGTKFWEKVRFDIFAYQYQEKVFREYLRNGLSDVKTVLELGAGTGRMTKIMLDELPNIEKYDAIDIKMVFNPSQGSKLTWTRMDIMSKEFDTGFGHMDYDLILASEIFLHIKPEDIDGLISKLSKMTKQIINIDWNFDPAKSEWCFIHDYDSLYKKYGGKLVDRKDMPKIQQSLFHYRFSS